MILEPIRYTFYMEDEFLPPDELAFGAFRWFMNHAELTMPECTVFYRDTSQKTFSTAYFYPAPSPLIKQDRAAAFLAVGSLDIDDEERVVLAYPVGSRLLTLTFPTLGKLNAAAKRLLKQFHRAFPDVKEIPPS